MGTLSFPVARISKPTPNSSGDLAGMLLQQQRMQQMQGAASG